MQTLREITGLRGAAAFSVLVLHVVVLYSFVRPLPTNPATSLLSYGWIGVDLFFVLSGFLLALPLLRRSSGKSEPGAWRTYVLKRWWRIAPPYYVSIVVALALAGQLSYIGDNPMDLFLHLTFLHSLSSETLTSIVPVYWTLASEFQFYLLLPLFVAVLRGRHWVAGLAVATGVTLLWRATTYEGPRELAWVSFTLPAFLVHFAVGILAARWHLKGFRLPIHPGYAFALIVAFLIVAPLAWLGQPIFTQGDGSWLGNLLLRPLLALGLAGIILLAVNTRSGPQRVLSSGPFQVLGEQSYSLYLIHVPVLVAINQWTRVTDYGLAAYLVVATIVSLLAGAAFHYSVERPSLAAREWLVSRRTPTRATDGAEPSSVGIRADPASGIAA